MIRNQPDHAVKGKPALDDAAIASKINAVQSQSLQAQLARQTGTPKVRGTRDPNGTMDNWLRGQVPGDGDSNLV